MIYLKSLLLASAFVFFISTSYGAYLHYSPVPFWDMWWGYLHFYLSLNSADWSIWWSQHNEHRIILSRILFWLDIRLGNGSIVFLIICNITLMTTAFIVFLSILRKALPGKVNSNIRLVTGTAIFVFIFSWVQHENITWGFQSQFFMAQLCPLISFYLLFLARASVENNQQFLKYFYAAIIMGAASAGTMANGVMVLPGLLVLGFLYRMNLRHLLIILSAATVVMFLYFYDYESVQHHSNPAEVLLNSPFGLVQYVLTYLGSPFIVLINTSKVLVSQFFGLVLVFLFALFGLLALKERDNAHLELCLICFIGYIFLTALITGSGRFKFGVEQALAIRYATPSLMSWSALLIIAALHYRQRIRGRRYLTLLLILPLLLIPGQLQALKVDRTRLFDKYVAALAIELDIRDQQQIGYVYPVTDVVDWMIPAVAANISIFGHPLIQDSGERMGKPNAAPIPLTACTGALDAVESIVNISNFYRIDGWIFNSEDLLAPSSLSLIDKQGNIVGYALVGAPRPDVAMHVHSTAEYSGFKGYLLKDFAGNSLTGVGNNPACRLQFDFSSFIPFTMYEPGRITPSNVTDLNSIAGGHDWRGRDYYQSDLNGLTVLGSWLESDADTGVINLRMKRGDAFYYRSGPVADNQTFLIQAEDFLTRGALPQAPEWTVLKFDNAKLPDEFVLSLGDYGAGWGEWSAIALRNTSLDIQ